MNIQQDAINEMITSNLVFLSSKDLPYSLGSKGYISYCNITSVLM